MSEHSTQYYAGVEIHHEHGTGGPDRTTVIVPDGTLVKYAGTGVHINSSRDDVIGQAHVTINTQDAPSRDMLANGLPALEVSLNDAELYDKEPDPIGYVMAVVHRIVPRPGETVAEAWERTNLGTVDGRDVDALMGVVRLLERSNYSSKVQSAIEALRTIIDRAAPTETLFATGALECPAVRIIDPNFDVDVKVGMGGVTMDLLPPVGDEEVVPVPASKTFTAYIKIPANVDISKVARAVKNAGAKLVDEMDDVS